MSEEEKIMLETNQSITYMETCFKNKIKQLQQENQQLKEKLEDMTLCRDIASGHRKELQDEELRQRRLKEIYKSVLDEIREYIENTEYDYVGSKCHLKDSVIGENILQILDKVDDL